MTERVFEASPGHDCIRFKCINGSERCYLGAGGSHGIGGVTLRWVVKGPEGAVQFVLMTGWLPEPERVVFEKEQFPPLPSDLGYHAVMPRYEGQTERDCTYTVTGRCYYDGSGLNAEEPFRVLCNSGGDALWEFLEAYYESVFNGGDFPKGESYRLERR